jgi:hypothetical protein
VQASYAEFRPKRTINVENTDRNTFTAIKCTILSNSLSPNELLWSSSSTTIRFCPKFCPDRKKKMCKMLAKCQSHLSVTYYFQCTGFNETYSAQEIFIRKLDKRFNNWYYVTDRRTEVVSTQVPVSKTRTTFPIKRPTVNVVWRNIPQLL